ncbi:MAG: TetR/AcrR family transcriptional regulator [Xanthobacteraceae bacterium]
MSTTTSSKKRSSGSLAVRAGRPSREFAGEVDQRILDAARRVFLERGLAGASIDEIAATARAGKPTIYARYPDKEALFAAVVMRNVATTIERLESAVPAGTTIEERLASAATTLLHSALISDTIDMCRVGISEARRFPELATSVHRRARQRGEDTIRRILGEVAQSDEGDALPAFRPEQLAATTHFFVDLVVMPLFLRALFGEKRKSLQAEIGPHVARSVGFFLAACRNGGVN